MAATQWFPESQRADLGFCHGLGRFKVGDRVVSRQGMGGTVEKVRHDGKTHLYGVRWDQTRWPHDPNHRTLPSCIRPETQDDVENGPKAATEL